MTATLSSVLGSARCLQSWASHKSVCSERRAAEGLLRLHGYDQRVTAGSTHARRRAMRLERVEKPEFRASTSRPSTLRSTVGRRYVGIKDCEYILVEGSTILSDQNLWMISGAEHEDSLHRFYLSEELIASHTREI